MRETVCYFFQSMQNITEILPTLIKPSNQYIKNNFLKIFGMHIQELPSVTLEINGLRDLIVMSSLFLHIRVTVFEEKSSYSLERVNQKVSNLEVIKHSLSLG